MGLLKLRIAMLLTMTLLFGFLAGVFGLILWQWGPAVEGSIALAGILAFVVLFTALQWWAAPSIIRWTTRMKRLDEKKFEWVHRDAEALARKAGVKKPKLWLVPDSTPNAFAFGRTRNDSNIAVHAGLLQALDRRETRAVLAHEMGHVKHRDVVLITVASMVPLLVYYLFLFFSPRGRRGNGGLGFIGVFLGALLAQFLSRLLVMYLSRTREYYADAFSARATGDPGALQQALKKISYGFRGVNPSPYRGKAAFYVSNPDEASALSQKAEGIDYAIAWEKTDSRAQLSEWVSTHPLTYKRLEALEEFKKTGVNEYG